jgi:hypothetical protein
LVGDPFCRVAAGGDPEVGASAFAKATADKRTDPTLEPNFVFRKLRM